ncbi:MAG: cation transporter [Flavobacteriaceae bacterium]|nr:cation transporter [Flavobacteriaceae bacterium]
MKKVIFSVAIVATMVFTACKSEKKETNKVEQTTTKVASTDASFGVRGNCGMCKKTIEKAANSVAGVTAANWDKVKKKIDISFDATKTNAQTVEKAIAASGYDTENVMGDLEAYNGLPGCCKYDHEMKMNQTGGNKDKKTH